MMPQYLEGLAEQRARSWEVELKQRALLFQIPHQPPIWQRWLGKGMVSLGIQLASWGEWLALREYRVREYKAALCIACK
jgi:hypothetical protein